MVRKHGLQAREDPGAEATLKRLRTFGSARRGLLRIAENLVIRYIRPMRGGFLIPALVIVAHVVMGRTDTRWLARAG